MINSKGIELIKSWEGYSEKAYLCPAKIWTIGYGSTQCLDGSPVKPGMVVTREQAQALLLLTIEEAEKRLRKTLRLQAIGDNVYAALTSIVFNCGTLLVKREGKWVNSTLLSAVNGAHWETAADAIYNIDELGNESGFKATAKGVLMTGLLRRRKAERILFETKSDKLIAL